MLSTRLLVVSALASLCKGAYVLHEDYGSDLSFFDHFSFFTDDDPTHGYVDYLDRGAAQQSGLISSDGGSVYMGVDYKNVASGRGRPSVRIETKKSYQHGLFVIDIAHMSGGICGTWPALWTSGATWPGSGEIDIMEGVNENEAAEFTIHTGPGCSIADDGMFSGTMTTSDCDVEAAGQLPNVGCNIVGDSPQTFGAPFNSNGGGVYAMEWTSEAISMWFFPRGKIPTDVDGGKPDPTSWGKPVARFQGGCDIDQSITEQRIVLDTDFCGDWAGSEWASSSCASKAPTCEEFVQNNPSAFKDAFWTINSFKVFNAGSPSDAEPIPAPEPTDPKEPEPQPQPEPTEPKPEPPAPTKVPAEPTEQQPQPPAPTEPATEPVEQPQPAPVTDAPQEPTTTKKPPKTVIVTNTVTVCPSATATGLSKLQKKAIMGHRRKYAPVYQG